MYAKYVKFVYQTASPSLLYCYIQFLPLIIKKKKFFLQFLKYFFIIKKKRVRMCILFFIVILSHNVFAFRLKKIKNSFFF